MAIDPQEIAEENTQRSALAQKVTHGVCRRSKVIYATSWCASGGA